MLKFLGLILISIPELFSIAHDWGRDELWGALKQVFLICFREEQRTRTWLAHSFSRENTVLGYRKFINQFPLYQHWCSYVYKKKQEDISRTFGLREKHWVFCPKEPQPPRNLVCQPTFTPFFKTKMPLLLLHFYVTLFDKRLIALLRAIRGKRDVRNFWKLRLSYKGSFKQMHTKKARLFRSLVLHEISKGTFFLHPWKSIASTYVTF